MALFVILMLSVCCQFAMGSYLMATAAGGGGSASFGNGGPATSAGISFFYGIWADSLGNLFLPDPRMLQLRKVNTSGIISLFIGSGNLNFTGVGGPALSVNLDGVGCPYGDTAGNLYFTSYHYFIWFYNHTSGYVSRFAGAAPGNFGYSGDGGPATSAMLNGPLGVFLSTNGILYFADIGNSVIRAIDTKTNIIATIAGNQTASSLGDGGPADYAQLSPLGIWSNTAGVLYIGDNGNNRIRKVATNGIISTIVGTGNGNYNGDDLPATSADLASPYNCQEDSLGNLYISDNGNGRVRMVSAATGNITTIAGDGSSTIVNGSIHVATAVGINPSMIQLDSLGHIYVGDNSYIRMLFASTAMPSAIPTAVPSIAPSTASSVVPTTSSPMVTSFRPSVLNVTVDSSSKSQRLSDLHIFYATFFPAFFVGFCIVPILGYYVWKFNKAKKHMKYNEINLEAPSVTVNGNEMKTVEVSKFYEWSL